MKKYLAVILAAVMLLGGALAEGLTEYSDANYSFQYPADWIRDATQDGTVILKSPEGNAYVRADLLLMDLITLTGDETTDARFIQVLMKSFAGEGTDGTENNLVLDGSWELVTAGGLHGFRAPGTWKPTGEPAVLTVFTGGGSMASFLMVGETAAALEETLTSSLKLTDRTTESVDGMKTWESDKLRLCYPDTFKMLDIGQAGVIVFAEITESPSMINVMTSELPDTEYTDDYGLETMREVLKAHDIPTGDHRAVQLTRRDAENYDLIIGFDDENMYYISAICGRENAAKYHRLTEFSGQKHEIDDPWYTRDFETAFREIYAGCEGLIRFGNVND